MRNTSKPLRPLMATEVTVNLWAFADEEGYVRRIAGKAYAMEGDDKKKVRLLRQLSRCDFLTATFRDVPASMTLDLTTGERFFGVAHAFMIHVDPLHVSLFGPLLDELEQQLDGVDRCINERTDRQRSRLPRRPLVLTTIILDRENGDLVPLMKDRRA